MQVVTISGFKGGTGKTTLAALLSVGAKLDGLRVAAFDLDRNTRNFSSFILRRQAARLLSPDHVMMMEHGDWPMKQPYSIEPLVRMARLDGYDLLVIDTGSGNFEGMYEAHLLADVIITPMNDSPADLHGLFTPAKAPQAPRVNYRDMIEAARFDRRRTGKPHQKWYVCRNRVSPLPTRIAAVVEQRVQAIAAEVGLDGVYEIRDRVSHRGLAADGRTVLDPTDGTRLTMSEVAGRSEVRRLMSLLTMPVMRAAA